MTSESMCNSRDSDKESARKLTSADKEQLQEKIDRYRKQKWKPSLRKRPFLREYIGVSGLIGAGIGLAYAPLSLIAIAIYYQFEGHVWATIMVLPAVPFFIFAHYMQMHPVAFLPICAVLFTAVGTGIGAGIYWMRNLVRKKKGQLSMKQ